MNMISSQKKKQDKTQPFFQTEFWSKITPYLFISPWVIGFLVFTLGPLVFSLIISFYDWPIVGKPEFVGLQNYQTMFTDDPQFWESLWITLKFAGLFVPFNIVMSLFLAILLHQKVRGEGIFRIIFYLPTIISGVALAMIWSWVYSYEYGIFNYGLSLLGIEGPNWLGDPDWSIFSIVLASLWGLGTMMLIFLTGLKNIPVELYESASINGATKLQQFIHITLPMLSPVILFNVVTSIISSFQQLTLALLLTKGGPLNSTYFYAMYIYDNAFKYFEMGYASANAWFMFILIMGLTFLVLKSTSMWVYYETEMSNKGDS